MSEYKFDCGCSFKILNEKPLKLEFIPDINFIPLDCPKTWDLFRVGNTKGVFQLESPLGQSMSKKLGPSNIEELSALNALLRPGPMEAIIDGKSLTQHYIDRKHRLEEVTYLHMALEPILKTTYGILVYQEQAIQIAQQIGGFNLSEADSLRKAIGKKKPEEMAKIKTMFLDKSKELGVVNVAEAEEIFGWIEKSQRYSFNKSHSVSYAMNGYLSAYAKAHFPRAFFKEYLILAKEKIKPKDEVHALVSNAKQMGISIQVPDVRIKNKTFCLRNKIIYFGITDIKGVGDNVVEKIFNTIYEIETRLKKRVNDWTWNEVLFELLIQINSTAARNMISSGCFDYLNIGRNRMLFQYDVIAKLSQREIAYCIKNFIHHKDLRSILTELTTCGVGREKGLSNKNRLAHVQSLIINMDNPPFNLSDNPSWVAGVEESLLGISLTYHQIDACDTSPATATCKEIMDGKAGTSVLGVQINNVNEILTKNGKNPGQAMAFITASDGSGTLSNIVAFPNIWKDIKGLVLSGNTLLLEGKIGKDSFVVNRVSQI